MSLLVCVILLLCCDCCYFQLCCMYCIYAGQLCHIVHEGPTWHCPRRFVGRQMSRTRRWMSDQLSN